MTPATASRCRSPSSRSPISRLRSQATKEIVDAWNADNPDIQVEIVQAPTDSLDDKLTTQFAGGVAPDIIHYEVLGIVPFARDGYLADLTDLLSKETIDDIDPGVLDSVTVDGQMIGAPDRAADATSCSPTRRCSRTRASRSRPATR